MFFNRVQEKLATELRCVEQDYYFNLIKDSPRYAYPTDSTQISGVRISKVAAPTSLADYYWLAESFRDEWRRATHGMRPSAWVYGYYARIGWFELVNAPTDNMTDGGIVTAWIIPPWVAVETAGATMMLPDWMRGTVQEGMQILARLTGRERGAAADDWKRWTDEIDKLREKVEDRSDDRRPAIRPPNGENPFIGMR